MQPSIHESWPFLRDVLRTWLLSLPRCQNGFPYPCQLYQIMSSCVPSDNQCMVLLTNMHTAWLYNTGGEGGFNGSRKWKMNRESKRDVQRERTVTSNSESYNSLVHKNGWTRPQEGQKAGINYLETHVFLLSVSIYEGQIWFLWLRWVFSRSCVDHRFFMVTMDLIRWSGMVLSLKLASPY